MCPVDKDELLNLHVTQHVKFDNKIMCEIYEIVFYPKQVSWLVFANELSSCSF